eukprot:TRINITY_DN30782_c0_g1_i1.p1 TRINITY_DN30782_c0_g1~~TRINITY_DN30782_c0_g1_i1.p1  ORF type:complete len:322 (+),score=98.78 TRINITY_DN30782_c0_g1_i1:36-1001(+)
MASSGGATPPPNGGEAAPAVAPDSGPAPALDVSMMKVFHPKLKELEQYLTVKQRELDEALQPWDLSTVDHGVLLTTSSELRAEMVEYKKSLVQHMKALWLEQTKRYQAYKNTISNTLTRRHYRELECLFSNLRYQTEPFDDGDRDSLTTAQQNIKTHLREAGFRYVADDVTLNNVGGRQIKERQSLDTITKTHHTMLTEGAKQDNQRLLKCIHKAMDGVNRILLLVDQKITMAHQASATPNLYRKVQPREVRGQDSPAAMPSKDPLAHAPTGSVMDILGGKAPSHSPSSSSKGGGDEGDSTENERSRKSASGHQPLVTDAS